jgi:hypothetical protein
VSLPMNNNAKKRIWLTAEQRLDVATRYAAGETPDAIGDSLGVCANNIRSTLRKQGVKERTRAEARRRFTHREDAFDTLTPASKYWIGFLLADGSIERTGTGSAMLDTSLQLRDKAHLEKMKLFLQAGHKISERKVNTLRIDGHLVAGPFFQARLSIRSQRLTDALEGHGMCNKSINRVAPPYLIDDIDFWRGLVDGDGHVGENASGPSLGLCGGEILMQQFIDFARNHDIGTNTTVRPHGNIFTASYTRHAAIRLARLLYTDAIVALDRKFADANALMSTYPEIV